MISPVVFTLYTSSCRSHLDDTYTVKFADDTAIIGLIEGNETNYRNTVVEFADWCEKHLLFLNVQKTKEMIIDFKQPPTHIRTYLLTGR